MDSKGAGRDPAERVVPLLEATQVAVRFDEWLVKYDFGELDEIALASAITRLLWT